MTTIKFLITPHSTVNQIFILRQYRDGRLIVKNEYSDLACNRCGKIDERAAMARGVKGMSIRSKRPFVLSADFFYLVDYRGERILRSAVPDLLDFTEIPTTNYFAVSPKTWIQPNENDPGYRFVDVRCAICGRPREVVWGKVPPRMRESTPLLAVNIEGQLGARPLWLVSKEVADELKTFSSQMTGMVVRPKEIDDE